MAVKLKAPVNSYESAVKQIEAGANEIYMGLEDSHLNRMSYSARAQRTSYEARSTMNADAFAKVVDYAHTRGVSVDFTANCEHVSNSADDFHRKAYMDYVMRGIELGCDALIVADIGNIIALKKNGVQLPVIVGSYLSVFNRESVKLFQELGASKICLPDQVTMDEIKSIKESANLEIEVFIGYGCSNIAGACNFCHNSGEKINIGVPCRASFRTEDKRISCALDACTDCAICSIPNLCDAGVDSLKLTGRESDCVEAAQITRMYKNAIQMYLSTGRIHKKEIVSLVSWWEDAMCSERCKYENSRLLQAYV